MRRTNPSVLVAVACLLLVALPTWGQVELSAKRMIAPMPRSVPTQATPVKDPDATTPWGKDAAGLVCRLVAEKDYVLGQAVSLGIEVRNTSAKEIVLLDGLHPHYQTARIEVKTPDGTKGSIGSNTPLTSYIYQMQKLITTVAPGQVVRVDIPDAKAFSGGFDKPGKYELTYGFIAKKLDLKDPKLGKAVLPADVGEQVDAAWTGTLVAPLAVVEIKELAKSDLAVHEWGVFTAYPDARFANADMKAEWATMPDFFYRQFPSLRVHSGAYPYSVKKPVIYFYTPRQGLAMKVQVDLPGGAPVVWWPANAGGAGGGVMRRGLPGEAIEKSAAADGKAKYFTSLTWDGWLGARVPNPMPNYGAAGYTPMHEAKLLEVPRKSQWIEDARLKDAAFFSCLGTPPAPPGAVGGWRGMAVESEKFIYYDGLIPAPASLKREKADARSITLLSQAKYAIPAIFAFRKAEAGNLAFAAGKTLAAGGKVELALSPVKVDDARKAIADALVAAGLFQAEADSLLKIWDEGFFAAEGLTVLHLLPQSEYDRMLPLKLTPAPVGGAVRVGLVMYPHMEDAGEVNAKVAKLIKDLDNDDFQTREQATAELIKMGPMALGPVSKTLAGAPTAEVKQRCEMILNEIDAAAWLEKGPEPGPQQQPSNVIILPAG